jgi:glucose-6-phosphate isomerase
MHLNSINEWHKLEKLAQCYTNNFDLREVLKNEGPSRISNLCVSAPYMQIDTSNQAWGRDVLDTFCKAAEQMGLSERRTDLLSGDVVNFTENRPALHARWRYEAVNTESSMPRALSSMLTLAENIRSRIDIDDIVHIGIGGSSLGIEIALQALDFFLSSRQKIHIVSNLDGHDLQQTLKRLTPSRTLIVVVSKSWSTIETLQNADSAIAWLHDAGIRDISSQVIAISSKPSKAKDMGIMETLDMPEGFGGRYSLWSSVGFPLAVALGKQGFLELLQGGADMDDHFAKVPLHKNLPVVLGFLDVWSSSFLGLDGRCIVPYHHGLRRLPAYLQQLEMESNGKRVGIDGRLLSYKTAGVIWGEEGSNSQHAFFQWLHQGTQIVPLELILVKEPEHSLPGHHVALLANGLAQAQALMQGKLASREQLPGHEDFPGNRPSTIIGLNKLTPASFGALLAMYEHRTFVAGVMWGINSFDQFGVELGKKLAKEIESRFYNGDISGVTASTAYWINWIRQGSSIL